MRELKFLNKKFTSQLSTDEIKQVVGELEEREILEKSTTEDGFRIVTKANNHFGYGLTFMARLEERNDGRTDVTIKTETRHDFFWLNLIFGGLTLSILLFENIRINGEIQSLSNRLFYALTAGIITILLNAYMIFLPARFLNKKVIARIK
ncbi:hypothetical protein [Roseivirga echinicomitans]|uniref:Uncharacterized protein n=1 Tax=Roseivirga echinicomitans TaxID=296218 RepID=A0A150X2B6_9BACT|nr:hypothetical protein [Roseivirga echinicomitans]KYG72858.1 hypothetical protein AWN68_09155 [Roseivirga echinicomitans]